LSDNAWFHFSIRQLLRYAAQNGRNVATAELKLAEGVTAAGNSNPEIAIG
jgi:hypothetical protein